MAESPSKRRRLSPTMQSSVDDAEDGEDSDRRNPTTPTRRASYLSPTKASLSRSHPNIFAKSPKRGSLTEPRGKLLRQELLGSRRNNTTTIPAPKSAPRPTASRQTDNPTNVPEQNESGRDGFADAIAQSFQVAAEGKQAGREQRPPAARSPLHTRQPPNASAAKRKHDDKSRQNTSMGLPVPKLVTRPDRPVRQLSEPGNEPTLPPTPIQLGLGNVPDRPRGLASSSSIGSKSGSGRHRRRVRGGAAAMTSSPLKPRDMRPISPTDFSDIEEVENEMAREAPESDIEMDTQLEASADLREKQTTLSKLHAELKKLRGHLVSIELLTDQLQQNPHLDIEEATLELLELKPQTAEGALQSPDIHPLFLKNPSVYLTLFAPGNLGLRHNTSAKQVQKRPKVVHQLILSAPVPWPSNTLEVSMIAQIDAEEATIEKITQPNSAQISAHISLQRWVDRRLDSELHRLDLGGIIWGVGQYFQACVLRAKAFYVLNTHYREGEQVDHLTKPKSNIDVEDALKISRYLHEVQLTISSPTGNDAHHQKQILINYEIDLNWVGEATAKVDISLTGVNSKAHAAAKELFNKILPSQDLVTAVHAVWDTLGFADVPPNTSMQAKPATKIRKAIAV